MSDEPFVTFRVLYNPVEADAIADLLRENGIINRVLGTKSASLVGVGQNIMTLTIEIPESEVERASKIIEELELHGGEELLREEGILVDADVEPDTDDDDEAEPESESESDTDDGEAEQPAPKPLGPPPSRLMAALWSLFLFGGSHLYIRRWLTAFFIAVGWFIAVWATAQHGIVGVVMMATLLVADLAAGQMVLGRPRKMTAGGILLQLCWGAIILGTASLLGFVAADGLWGNHGAAVGRDANLGFIVITSPAIAFGLWLLPKWWRVRKQRQSSDGPTLGKLFARQVWLFLNSWSSIILALALLTSLGSDLLGETLSAREHSVRAELSVSCSESEIILTNETKHPGTVTITAAIKGKQDDYWKIGADGNRINLPVPEHAVNLSAQRVELQAGASKTITYQRAATGPCNEGKSCQTLALTFNGELGADNYWCSLRREEDGTSKGDCASGILDDLRGY